MGPRFVDIDRDTPLLLPPNLRDWVSCDHLSHFILDAVVLEKVKLEWALVNTAYNLKRLHRMVGTV